MGRRFCLAMVAACALGVPAAAQDGLPDLVRLSPVERAAALEAGARHDAAEPPVNGALPGIHGEIGIAVGSNGSRAVSGAARIPLGANGAADFSFLTDRTGWPHR